MKSFGTKAVMRSAERLAQGEASYGSTGDRIWLKFLRRESSILLRRVLRLWFRVRIRREKEER